MPATKSRNWSAQEDQALQQFMNQRSNSNKEQKITWNEIALQIASKFQNKVPTQQQNNLKTNKFTKTGKQCRERQLIRSIHRWMNHLNHGLNKNSKWTVEQNRILFNSHNQLGNKWSTIANRLPGRTDNCVKNHFYSVLRRGMRKINQYIEQVRRKQSLVKTFKNQMLNKILLLSESEGKYDDKFHFKKKAKELALQIKELLIKLSGEDWTKIQIPDKMQEQENQNSSEIAQLQEKGYQMINQFAKNCKKKKSKKTVQNNQEQISDVIPILDDHMVQNTNSNKNTVQKKKTKSKDIKIEIKQQKNQLEFNGEQMRDYDDQQFAIQGNQNIVDNQSMLHLLNNPNSPSSMKLCRSQQFFGSSQHRNIDRTNSISKKKPKNDNKQHKISQFNHEESQDPKNTKKAKNKTKQKNINIDKIKNEHTQPVQNLKQNNLIKQIDFQQADFQKQQHQHQFLSQKKQPLSSIKNNKIKIIKADSMDQKIQIQDEMFAIFKTKNQFDFNSNKNKDDWFNGSGVEADKKFGEALGGMSFQGNNSFNDLFGSDVKKQMDGLQSQVFQKNNYRPQHIDFTNNQIAQANAFRKNSLNCNLNQSQQIEKPLRINGAQSSFMNFGNRSGHSISFSPMMLKNPSQHQDIEQYDKKLEYFMQGINEDNNMEQQQRND